jgi:hypothetical protein
MVCGISFSRRSIMCRIVVTTFLVALVGSTALAEVIVEQPYDGVSGGRTAQEFPDFDSFSTFQLDDITTTQDWFLGVLTVWGEDAGDPNDNMDVFAEVWDDHPEDPNCGTVGQLVASAEGEEDPNTATLTFDFAGEPLSAGSYWMTVYVVRNFGDHGIWKWYCTSTISGSEAYYYNPGNGLGFGPCPMTGSERYGTVLDMAFRLEGTSGGGCPGDVDGDGDTDLSDLAALLAAYLACEGDPDYNPAADFDGSGCIDLSDLAALLADYLCGT